MQLLPKTIVTVVSAALLAALPVAAADARPTHHRGAQQNVAAHPHGKAHQHGRADRLAGLRRGASHAIGAQLKAVQALVDRAGTRAGADAAGLQDALESDLAAVQADLDGVASAAGIADLHQLMMGAITCRQVARLQFTVVVAADQAAAQADLLSVTVQTLQGQLAELGGSVDVTAGQQTLEDATSLLTAVAAQVPGLVQYVLALSPTMSRTDLHAAIAKTDAELTTIADALAQAAADVASVQADYGL